MRNGDPSAGDTILDGKYRLENIIGSGGMGRVFRATHIEIGREVAIKFLRDKHVDDPQIIRRFQREARLAGSIGHHNICEVTDCGTDASGSHYLLMPLLVGESFDKVLKNPGGISLPRVLDIMVQMMSALEAAHKNQIVHRDLKPNNIFITSYGDREDFVKLLDFGISKVLGSETLSEATETGVSLGTPYYMAPEQAQGTRDIDYRVDIYAAGVILYEALTGRRPFEGDSYNAVMFKIISEQIPLPRTLNPLIPPAIEAVVIRAMERNREDRFPNATEMRQALEACPSEFLDEPFEGSTSMMTTASRTGSVFTPIKTELEKDEGITQSSESIPGRSRWRWIAASLALIMALVVLILWSSTGKESSDEAIEIQIPVADPQPPPVPSPVMDEKPIVVSNPEPEPEPELVLPDVETQVEEKPIGRKPRRPAKTTPPVAQKEEGSVEGREGTKLITEF